MAEYPSVNNFLYFCTLLFVVLSSDMNIDVNSIKQRYGIIGFDAALDHAINIAVQVAATDLSVLITGESGVGKENFPRIIHDNSTHKHGKYIAVNCGAIPEGTIDSELFGHEKGAFTGADRMRKGYFEEADGGTIFLDEVADLPLGTQIRLLRVLENGEFIRVGASEVLRTNVRVVAATNVDIADRIAKGKFREDLFYRLNSVPIHVPALRERKGDIYPLFMKFAADFSFKYHFPPVELTPDAVEKLTNYTWPGNVRQLKHVTEQISLMESSRTVNGETIAQYLVSPTGSTLPVLRQSDVEKNEQFQRETIMKFYGIQQEIKNLKVMINHLAGGSFAPEMTTHADQSLPDLTIEPNDHAYQITRPVHSPDEAEPEFDDSVEVDDAGLPVSAPGISVNQEDAEDLTLAGIEKKAIIRALRRHHGNRKQAAEELGISDRTLYRKIEEYGLKDLGL